MSNRLGQMVRQTNKRKKGQAETDTYFPSLSIESVL